MAMRPLGYTVAPEDASPTQQPVVSHGPMIKVSLSNHYALTGAVEWFIDTCEGRLRGDFRLARTNGEAKANYGIYWREPIPSLVWRADLLPLDPAQPLIGFRTAGGVWHVIRFTDADCSDVRLLERLDGKEGLFLLSAVRRQVSIGDWKAIPPSRDVTEPCKVGACRLRCVGNEYIVSNGAFTAAICRVGGLVRWIERDGKQVQVDHNLYGDQQAFATGNSRTIDAKFDAECGARICVVGAELRMRFEGQLRGMDRFALKSPPVDFYNEYAFGAGRSFRHAWGFRSEGGVSGQIAFLAANFSTPTTDTFRFVRNDLPEAVGGFHTSSGQQAQLSGPSIPDCVDFYGNSSRLWSLSGIHYPPDGVPDAFVDLNRVFLTLLDGSGTMEKGRWYDFSCTWKL